MLLATKQMLVNVCRRKKMIFNQFNEETYFQVIKCSLRVCKTFTDNIFKCVWSYYLFHTFSNTFLL